MLHPSSKLVLVMLVSDISISLLSLRIVNIELNSVPVRQMQCFFPNKNLQQHGGGGGGREDLTS